MKSEKAQEPCQRKIGHEDNRHNPDYYAPVDPSKKNLPEGAIGGEATTAGNNCLIHSLYLAPIGKKWGPANKGEQEAYCATVRSALDQKHKAPKNAFLGIHS